jgi:hypothetical protein
MTSMSFGASPDSPRMRAASEPNRKATGWATRTDAERRHAAIVDSLRVTGRFPAPLPRGDEVIGRSGPPALRCARRSTTRRVGTLVR